MENFEISAPDFQGQYSSSELHLVDVPNHTEPLLPLVSGATYEMFLEGMPRRDHLGRALTPI